VTVVALLFAFFIIPSLIPGKPDNHDRRVTNNWHSRTMIDS